MLYDVTERIRTLSKCSVCRLQRRSVRTLYRYAEDDEYAADGESIDVCEPCLVDAMLDGIRP